MHAVATTQDQDWSALDETPVFSALGSGERPPDVGDQPSLWLCLKGQMQVQSRDGPFLLTRKRFVTLPADYRATLLPGHFGVGLVVTLSSAQLGPSSMGRQLRGGAPRGPFALEGRASHELLTLAFNTLRHEPRWDPAWRAFQAIHAMHLAQASQTQVPLWLQRSPGRTEMHRRLALHRLLHARNRILNQPFNEHDMDSLAAAAKYSKSHFIKAFREVFAETPGALHAGARIAMAKRLIASSGMSIGEIAADVGYGSRCAFSRRFKSQVGINASSFRKARRHDAVLHTPASER